MAGRINKVRTVEVINPPMTTMANGFCVSLPVPVEIAAGNNPIIAIERLLTKANDGLSNNKLIALLMFGAC